MAIKKTRKTRTKVAVETPLVETPVVETPVVETPVEVATEESTAKKEFRAYIEHIKANAPVEYASKEKELLEELNKL